MIVWSIVSFCERGIDSSFEKMQDYDDRRKQTSSGRMRRFIPT
jgi:hypothetical protein